MITEFKGDYRWLSNFQVLQTVMLVEGIVYPTVEHYYVAMKTLDVATRSEISQVATAGQVKRFGRTLSLRDDWELIKRDTMLQALRFKYSEHNPVLRNLLIQTSDCIIQEGNWWGDKFWGICLKTGKGENHLGRLIMQVRSEIRND